jgi:Ca2+-binding EF-hand superfamily protein
MYWFMGFIALGHAVNAFESPEITTRGPAGDGVIAGVPGHGVMILFGGQDIGSSLLKACDVNQDGVATATEVKAALLNWFQQADADRNSALSEVELATALNALFPPPPQPPPGVPPPPDDQALLNLLAKTMMAAVDANHDGWITLQEASAFVDENFSKWDADKNGGLNSSEFAAAFAQFMPGPSFNRTFEGGTGLWLFHAIAE